MRTFITFMIGVAAGAVANSETGKKAGRWLYGKATDQVNNLVAKVNEVISEKKSSEEPSSEKEGDSEEKSE